MDNPTHPVTAVPLAGNSAGDSLSQDLTGQELGDFQILRRLGEGGMGQVYLSEQKSLKRPVALKILKADLAANPTSLARFKAEAEAVARATHANIVQVYATGELNGLHFIALEYIDGLNLRDYLAKKGPPDLPLALNIMRQGGAALQRAGELGIIHRDIKPENIMLTRKGAVKIADFGLSRFANDQKPLNLTQSGVAMGTPLYMSPEQVEGKSLDSRTDIYSFGVTCYHMLAGHPPFRGQSAFEVALQHVQAEPESLERIRPDIPRGLCAIVHKMMAKKPDHRYATAHEILLDLARLHNGQTEEISALDSKALAAWSLPTDLVASVPTVPVASGSAPSVAAGVSHPGHGARRRLALVGASVLLALLGGAYAGWQTNSSRSTSDAAPEKLASEPSGDSLGYDKHLEHFLVAAVKKFENPQNWEQRNTGIRYCFQLGELYLDQWRLDEADQFFENLIHNPFGVREYTAVGKLGQAIVLAFPRDNSSQGEPFEESAKIFLELFTARNSGIARLTPFINRNPRFLHLMVKALDYDAANYKAHNLTFPPALEEFRKTRPLPNRNLAPAKPAIQSPGKNA
jgi:serine/threonine-protein kinase